MRLALPGSALVHAGAVGLLFVGFVWPEAEDAAPPAPVTVDIVPMANVASNVTQTLTTTNTVSLVSSGAPETVVPVEPETVEPVSDSVEIETPAPIEPIDADSLEPLAAAPAEPIELSATAPSLVAAVPALASPTVTLAPLQEREQARAEPAETLQPVETQTLVTPPAMPTPSSQRPPPPPERPREPPREEPRPSRADPPANPSPGNRGDNDADSVAAASAGAPRTSNNGSGGDAEVARYPSRVIAELRSAMRQGGARGEVVVRFTVQASGALAGVSIGRSSGSADVDSAGISIVQRAAPFPPIPASAGRNSWTFDVPLAFGY